MTDINQDFYFKKDLFQMFNVFQKSRLIKVLNKNGINFFLTLAGDPFVHKDEFHRKKKRTISPEIETEWTPNIIKRGDQNGKTSKKRE
ncbi:hypothetical protein ACLRAA_02730 [Gallibacterium anatis]|uniref:Uncharacterized protein n=1 Tax=Gallibacterium anatis TaxID=750 RepID=A0A1A7P6L0_9PAST|nr:hypothetical protein [Gallibacterium anatis]KGQ40310.1 hypothetical protein JP35_03205 [Gallibacterium anatis]KGQ68642.1 hypothetical protein IO47_03760 [Gallibacterium anatis]MBP4134206.1 hypothetical protein [Gallibacterium anatis]OBW97445.1 hypothetical protein QV02_00010 [Gallibacterium anatis]OBX00848.1 hypothetical protein QV03_01185 [Gallibacterium anatis]